MNNSEIDKLRKCRLMVNQSKMTDDEKRDLKIKLQLCLSQMRRRA